MLCHQRLASTLQLRHIRYRYSIHMSYLVPAASAAGSTLALVARTGLHSCNYAMLVMLFPALSSSPSVGVGGIEHTAS